MKMTETNSSVLTIAALSALVEAVAGATHAEAAYSAVADAAETFIGHRLFTVMAFEAGTMQVQRLYSSNPEVYPPGGQKAKRNTPWGHQVLEQGLPFIGRNAEDIRNNFDDHEVIFRLGLASVMNVPIRICGKTIGTMNLLHQSDYYSTEDLERGFIFAGLLSSPLCLNRL